MIELKCVIAPLNHYSEILFALAHHRRSPILALFSNPKQKQFYELLLVNLPYTNIKCQFFEEYLTPENSQINPDSTEPNHLPIKTLIIMDVPKDFETMEHLLSHSHHPDITTEQTILLVMKPNKKYINMMRKKVLEGQINVTATHYENSKLVDINSKIKELVETNYDINRAAFYSYGAYLNNFRENRLKLIFKTEAIDVDMLAKSFGFTVAPRVKDGKFLKQAVRRERNRDKMRLRKLEKRRKKVEEQKMAELTAKKAEQQSARANKPAGKTKQIRKQNKNSLRGPPPPLSPITSG